MTISRDERLELADLIDQDKLDTLDDLGTHQRCLIVAALRAQAERAPVAYLHRYKGSVIEPQLGFEMAINPQWTSEPLYLATPIAGQRQEDPDDGSYTSDPRIGRQMTATERAAWAAIPQPASAAPQQSPIERLDMREIAAHLHDQGLSPDKAGEIAHSLMQRFDIGLRQSPPTNEEMENYRLALAWISKQSTDEKSRELAKVALTAFSREERHPALDWEMSGTDCPACHGDGRIGVVACTHCGATGRAFPSTESASYRGEGK